MKHFLFAAASIALLVSCGPKALKSGLDPDNFKGEYDGQPTALYTLVNEAGMEVSITNFGGRIVSIMVPDRNGEFKDVVLGFDNVNDYFPENHSSDFGAAIGRYANRIGFGRLVIDGNEYKLPANNMMHCLHGGPTGWQYKVYNVVEADQTHIKLEMDSPDGDNSFPGAVTAFVTYTLTEDNKLDIVYEATTDAPTVINMTNHSYFNLAGDPAGHSVCDDYMVVNSSIYTPTDRFLIPTGEMASVEGTPLDFRQKTRIGDRIDSTSFQAIAFAGGYDHNWVLDTAGDDTVPAAIVFCPESGIILTEYTNEPGVQVYSGNFLDGSLTGKNGAVYGKRSGICLESQHYPDSPNKEEWPTTVLRPGEKYYSHCVFAFSVCTNCKDNADSCAHNCKDNADSCSHNCKDNADSCAHNCKDNADSCAGCADKQ